MTRERRALVGALVATLMIAAVMIAAVLYAEARRRMAEEAEALAVQIRAMEERLAGAEQRAHELPVLEAELSARSRRFYAHTETDVFSFGLLMNDTLEEVGMTVERYFTVDGERPTLEFAVSGGPREFLRFLARIDNWPRAIGIASLSVRADSGLVEGTFRIGYATVQ